MLQMVARGASNTEIAAELNLGEKTIRNYVSRIYHKLALSNRAQMATFAAVNADAAAQTGENRLVLTANASLVEG